MLPVLRPMLYVMAQHLPCSFIYLSTDLLQVSLGTSFFLQLESISLQFSVLLMIPSDLQGLSNLIVNNRDNGYTKSDCLQYSYRALFFMCYLQRAPPCQRVHWVPLAAQTQCPWALPFACQRHQHGDQDHLLQVLDQAKVGRKEKKIVHVKHTMEPRDPRGGLPYKSDRG